MEVGDLEGVQTVEGDENSKEVVIAFDPPATEDSIIELMKEINYAPAIV
jgi:hypothetical protein